MSIEQTDTVEDLLVDIIKRTDKILEETDEFNKVTDSKVEGAESEKLLKELHERTGAIFHKDTPSNIDTGEEVATTSEAGNKHTDEVLTTGTQIVNPFSKETTNSETIPPALPSFNPCQAQWKISQRIILTGKSWSPLAPNIEGIRLNQGIYKIQFALTHVQPGHGIAIFTEKREFIRLLVYLPNNGSSTPTVWSREEIYLRIDTPCVIGLTNSNREFRPSNFVGCISLTAHKLKTTPS